ncbi:MAG: transglutaminase domain protein [Frankiales bacterium]|nr:transglutaminase domain protein [Frankiales bacterium]
MHRSVSCFLAAQVLAPAVVELQIAVAATPETELLTIALDGAALVPTELATEAGGRLHRLEIGPGRLEVTYRATVAGSVPSAVTGPLDATTYLRPSRYAESDHLVDLAATEFGGITDRAELVRSVAAWVGGRLKYVSGSSIGTDGAVDTLAAGIGVCRDFAHLTVGLLRARDVPARVAAVYAPGLLPMDFHAVAEALIDGQWYVADPTLLAPRTAMLRIATGRDAADTAFLSSYGGDLRLDLLDVTAVIDDGGLPPDDLDQLVRLA